MIPSPVSSTHTRRPILTTAHRIPPVSSTWFGDVMIPVPLVRVFVLRIGMDLALQTRFLWEPLTMNTIRAIVSCAYLSSKYSTVLGFTSLLLRCGAIRSIPTTRENKLLAMTCTPRVIHSAAIAAPGLAGL
jgi:hypothetical protein